MSRVQDIVRASLGVLSTGTRLKKQLDTEFRNRFDTSVSRFDVMAALDRAGAAGLRARELSVLLKVSEGNTTQVTAPMIRDGLIRRVPCPEDARAAIFTLTDEGQALFDSMAHAHRAWISTAFEDFTADELKTLRRLLKKITIPGNANEKDAA